MAKSTQRTGILALCAILFCSSYLIAGYESVDAALDEIIVTARLIDRNSGNEFTNASILLTDSTGETVALSHGERTTIPEGEIFRIVLVGVGPNEFIGWQPWFALRIREIDVAFYEDTVIEPQLARSATSAEERLSSGEIIQVDLTDLLSIDKIGSMREQNSLKSPSTDKDKTKIQKSLTEVWVNFRHLGLETGTYQQPYNSVYEGMAAAVSLGNGVDAFPIYLDGGYSEERISLNPSKPIRLEAPNTPVRIGGDYTHWYTITIGVAGSGAVSGGGGYTPGQTATLTAAPSSGWSFSHWSGNLSGYTNPDSITVVSDMNVTAVFVQDPAEIGITGANIDNGSNDPLPTEVVAGDTYQVEWHVNNSGGPDDATGGNWSDNVFLSRDDLYDDQDKKIGDDQTILDTTTYPYTASTEITIPDVSPGSYHLIFRTDIDEQTTHTQQGREDATLTHQITIIDPELQ